MLLFNLFVLLFLHMEKGCYLFIYLLLLSIKITQKYVVIQFICSFISSHGERLLFIFSFC